MPSKLKKQTGKSGGKVRITETPQTPSDDKHPIFCLQYLSRDFSLANCNREEKAAFADTLAHLSQMTWGQLRFAPRHGAGYEKIDRDSIRADIPAHLLEDVSHFVAFRFYGLAPMVGYKENEVLHVVWLDREFRLYDH